MLKKIEVISPQGDTMEMRINPANVVFLSEVDLPTNITGIDGQPKTNKGTALALANGMIINSELSINNVEKLLGD